MIPLIHEIKVGAITGMRVWRVHATDLCSVMHRSYPGAWVPNKTHIAEKLTRYYDCLDCPGLAAPCTASMHIGPRVRCGIHATNSLEYFKGHISPYWFSSPLAFGLVRLFGRVVECEYGWRAEKAEVHSLIGEDIRGLLAVGSLQLHALAKTYRVPLIPPSAAQELVSPLPGEPSQ